MVILLPLSSIPVWCLSSVLCQNVNRWAFPRFTVVGLVYNCMVWVLTWIEVRVFIWFSKMGLPLCQALPFKLIELHINNLKCFLKLVLSMLKPFLVWFCGLVGVFSYFIKLMGPNPVLSVPYLSSEVRGVLPGYMFQAFTCGKDLACNFVLIQGFAVLSVWLSSNYIACVVLSRTL